MSNNVVVQTKSSAREKTEPLKIVRVDAIPVALPLKKPIVMAGERLEVSRNLLVRIEAANGLIGWGEASSAPMMTGDLLFGMVAAVKDHLAPLVLGEDALARAQLAYRCAHALHGNTGAKCAVDMAINDLAGRHLGVSLSDMFGGALRDTLQPMYLLSNKTVEDDIAEAVQKLEEGWSFFKLKAGFKDPLEEAAAAIAIRRKLGHSVALCADANTGMSFVNARIFSENAGDANLLYLEQPFKYGEDQKTAALAHVSRIPLNGDESIGSIGDILTLHQMGAIQGANIKTIKMGGIGAAVKAMSVCEALGLNINLACKVAESSITAAATVHLGCIAPNLSWGINITNHYLAEDITDNAVTITNGKVRRPQGFGLGVSVNEAKVEKYRVH